MLHSLPCTYFTPYTFNLRFIFRRCHRTFTARPQIFCRLAVSSLVIHSFCRRSHNCCFLSHYLWRTYSIILVFYVHIFHNYSSSCDLSHIRVFPSSLCFLRVVGNHSDSLRTLFQSYIFLFYLPYIDCVSITRVTIGTIISFY